MPPGNYPDLEDLSLDPDGQLWTALSVWGVEVIKDPFSEARSRERVPGELIANPYTQSVVSLVQGGDFFVGHHFLANQFSNGLLTQAKIKRGKGNKISLPLVLNKN